jgi:predicted small integral membrane protein
MRHVLAVRTSKAVLVLAIALFYTILVFNNISDYGSNYQFVRHVLMMDSTFPGNHGMWRAVNCRWYIRSSISASSPGNQSLCFSAGGLVFGC